MIKNSKNKCGDCGYELKKGEMHHHLPDIFLDVWNCQHSLKRTINLNNSTQSETLPFTVPEDWAEWILDTCGGMINRSGMYRLPGRIWEWCLAKMRGDEEVSQFLEKSINQYLSNKRR